MDRIDFIVESVIKQFILEGGGRVDFKKSAMYLAGENFGTIMREIPGARYPLQERGDNNTEKGESSFIRQSEFNPDNDLQFSLSLSSQAPKELFLFAYGCCRMVLNGEVNTDKEKSLLSDICIYLTSNPDKISKLGNPNITTIDSAFSDRDFKNGVANFYNLSFKELVKLYKSDIKGFNSEKKLESKLETSNGYYLFPCFGYGAANEIGRRFNQGMCFFNSPTFWQFHTGDSGALFMFKKHVQYDKDGNKLRSESDNFKNEFYKDDVAKDEIVISTQLDEDGNVYIDGITNGYNKTLYNVNHHKKTNGQNNADDFTDADIKATCAVLGNIYNVDIFTYCIKMTERRQTQDWTERFSSQNYTFYSNRAKSKKTITTENPNMVFFVDKQGSDNVLCCIDNDDKLVFMVQEKGFITCEGKQVGEEYYNQEPFITILKIANQVFGDSKKWGGGFRANNRNKSSWVRKEKVQVSESKLYRIIAESIIRNIKKGVM